MKKSLVVILSCCLTVSVAFAQEAAEADENSGPIEAIGVGWMPVAYLEFSPGSKEFHSDLEGFAPAKTVEDTFESKEKRRVETLKTKDPVTGKEIVETETIRSGSSSKTRTRINKTSLLTIDARTREEESKKSTEYLLQIDGVEFFYIPEREMKEARKLAKDYVKALEKVGKGVRGHPFVNMVFGNKERGAVISCRSNRRLPELTLRIWVKGRSYDLEPSPGALGFFTDLADLKI